MHFLLIHTPWQHHDYCACGGTYIKGTWADTPINWSMSNNLRFDHTRRKCLVFIEKIRDCGAFGSSKHRSYKYYGKQKAKNVWQWWVSQKHKSKAESSFSWVQSVNGEKRSNLQLFDFSLKNAPVKRSRMKIFHRRSDHKRPCFTIFQ